MSSSKLNNSSSSSNSLSASAMYMASASRSAPLGSAGSSTSVDISRARGTKREDVTVRRCANCTVVLLGELIAQGKTTHQVETIREAINDFNFSLFGRYEG